MFAFHCVTIGERIFPKRAAVDEINEVEEKDKTSKSAAECWFQRFDARDLDLKGKPRSGRPTKMNNEDQLINVSEDELSSSAREPGTELDDSQTTVPPV
ncbi:hypothetical protein KIN20_013592 [Parelaphostrongylus tenuis]|uniref:Mos1 transposase HTH domain-containing protein n=1 Tax=Parelaphostrongylus tenuis TaxID=148309 RepID=A0AAD5MUS2_PARTN|nr:hypothetical protein KIN20_013592 [Parelaphostrongylus tenuis]